MANIMMTDACNLACPYCFANEFVNKDRNYISKESFDEAVSFITGDGSHDVVGIIGGEPTLHPQFEEMMRSLIVNTRVRGIMLYTNGLLMDRFWDVCAHPKMHMLINCNPPENIGKANYEHLCRNLDTLLIDKLCIDRVTLGINMYKPDFEYMYIIELLRKYDFHHVRVSITVPNMDTQRNLDAHGYFQIMKPRLMDFFHALMKNDVLPNFDCNKIPYCLLTKEEMQEFAGYMNQPFIHDHYQESNISHNRVLCRPVIDIRQDLTAVRCFGLSETTKENIRDFRCIKDLENYYLRTVDAYAYNTVYSSKCIDCYERKTMNCTGGCLAFKIAEINRLQEHAI